MVGIDIWGYEELKYIVKAFELYLGFTVELDHSSVAEGKGFRAPADSNRKCI